MKQYLVPLTALFPHRLNVCRNTWSIGHMESKNFHREVVRNGRQRNDEAVKPPSTRVNQAVVVGSDGSMSWDSGDCLSLKLKDIWNLCQKHLYWGHYPTGVKLQLLMV